VVALKNMNKTRSKEKEEEDGFHIQVMFSKT
jgi:hypothetical protein